MANKLSVNLLAFMLFTDYIIQFKLLFMNHLELIKIFIYMYMNVTLNNL